MKTSLGRTHRWIEVIIGISLLLASTVAVWPQQAGVGVVEGMVVRLGTLEPISGVNVELRRVEGTAASPLLPDVFGSGYYSVGATVRPNSPNPADAFYATTGSDGTFKFRNLKPGKYRLLAAHPDGTYYPAEFGQHNPRGPGFDFNIEDVQAMKIRIEMAGMGSVSGRVIGADGKPALHAHVLAAEIAYANGARVLNQVQGVETDERGNYRLFWLPPGRYYIGAFPEGIRRWQTAVPFGPPTTVDSLNQAFSQSLINYRSLANGEIVREVYETVYSPGETNPDAANVIDLRLGSNVAGIDISLAAGRHRAVTIRGVVIDGLTGKPAGASLRAVPRMTGPVTVAPVTQAKADGTFEIDGLMQGDYFITATVGERTSIQTAIEAVKVDTSDINGLRLVVSPGAHLPGHISMDGTDANGYRVGLLRDNRFLPAPIYSGSSPSGTFSLERLHAGSYQVSVLPPGSETNPRVFVKSIRLGGVEYPEGIVQVGDSPSGPLEVALGSNGGTAEGQVRDLQRQPAPNVQVVLVPADSRRPDLFKTATTDFAGNFRIQGVAPGNYLEFAWPWVPDGVWQVPEFLRTVERQGTRISLSEGSTADTPLTLLPEAKF